MNIWLKDMPPNCSKFDLPKVESRPKNTLRILKKDILYSLDEYRIQKIEFYNRRGDLEKILIFDNYKQYLNNVGVLII